jgi:hypothetical protein
MPTRRAVSVILGCFILFGAGAIANGVTGSLDGLNPSPQRVISYSSYVPSQPPIASSDPYAGAAVPTQRAQDIFTNAH